LKNITSIFVISLLFVLSTGLSLAAEIKIGVVNSARIMAKAPQAGKATAALEKEFAPRQKRLIALQKEIKKLDEKLADPTIRQLRERITQSLYLSRLCLQDIQEYLNFRLRASGYTGPDLFSRKLAKCIDNYSHGLIRRINIIADKCLLSAFSNDRHSIKMGDVHAAALDCSYQPQKQWWKPWATALMFCGFLSLLNLGSSDLEVSSKILSIKYPMEQYR